MNVKVFGAIATFLPLMSLTAACSKTRTDTPQAVQASNEATSADDSDRATEEHIGNQRERLLQAVEATRTEDPLPTHMNCELDGASTSSIRRLETQLVIAQTRYGDNDLTVKAFKETIKQVKEDALNQCLAMERDCQVDRFTAARVSELQRQLAAESPASDSAKGLDANPVYQNLKFQLGAAQVDAAEAHARCLAQQEKRRH